MESLEGSPRQKALSASSLRREKQREEEARAKLQEWMNQKRKERHRDYKEQRQHLIEREHSPFKPSSELMRTVSVSDK